MTYLSVPIPRFLRRLFNVVSTLAVSNQYFVIQKTDSKGGNGVAKDASTGNLTYSSGAELEQKKVSSVTAAFKALRAEGAAYLQRSRHGGPSSNRAVHSITPDGMADFDFPDRQFPDEYLESKQNGHSSSPSPSPSRHRPTTRRSKRERGPLSPIQELLLNPLLYDPVRKPRYPLVLCHGLYGFDVRGPSAFPLLQMHYWSNVMRILKKKIGAEVIVTGVPGTGSVESRAEKLDAYLSKHARGRAINFVAHSMGGLDCRHLISNVKPEEYVPLSLTTVCTPHRGSPFMDWCTDNIGIGKPRNKSVQLDSVGIPSSPDPPPKPSNTQFTLSSLPSSFTTLLLSIIDSPAYYNLTTSYLRDVFNPATPDDPRVKYYSVAAKTENINVWHPLWLPKLVLDGVEEKERKSHTRSPLSPPREPWEADDWGNDGLVSVRSAKWGEFLGTLDGADHWEVRGAGGLSNVDLSLPSVVKNSLSDPLSVFAKDGWSWRDWGRFVGLWKEEQARQEEKARSIQQSSTSSQASKDADKHGASSGGDDVLKMSTEKLSAVVDWISEQVPGSSSASKAVESSVNKEQEKVDIRKAGEAKEPELKFDLERFYIALTRKLYNEGL